MSHSKLFSSYNIATWVQIIKTLYSQGLLFGDECYSGADTTLSIIIILKFVLILYCNFPWLSELIIIIVFGVKK